MTVVRIPPTLRAETGGARQVEAEGGTVRDLLDDLMARFPALQDRILEEGDVAPFVNVYVGGEDVRTLDGLETPVRDGQQVILLPAMAGGSLASLAAVGSRRAKPGSAGRSRRWTHDPGQGRITHTVPAPDRTSSDAPGTRGCAR